MSTETLPSKTPTHEELGITHIAFLHDTTRALCGKRLKGVLREDLDAECVVCLELEDAIKREAGR